MTTKADKRKYISIIIPVYNDSFGLRATLDSLICQQYDMSNVEIIVIDNNSKDDTLEIAKSFQQKFPKLITVLSEIEIQSSYASRNRGITFSTGNILAFIDAECVADINWLKSGVESIESSGFDLIAGDIKFIFRSHPPTFWDYYDSCRKLNQRLYAEQGFGATANLFVKRKVINEIGLFKSHLISGGDWEFGTRATGRGFKICFLESATVYHPARSTFTAILKKAKRVAIGQMQLEQEPGVSYKKASIKSTLSLNKVGPRSFHGIQAKPLYRLLYPCVEKFFMIYNLMIRKGFYS